MKIYILLTFFILIVSGCEIKNPDGTEIKSDTMKTNTNTRLTPIVYKGMFLKTKDAGLLTECGTGKKFLISPKGDVAKIDSVYNSFNKKTGSRKIYINVEGFTSVQQRLREKVFDTVVVITRTIGTDTTFNCER